MQYLTFLRRPSLPVAVLGTDLLTEVERLLIGFYRTLSDWRQRAQQRRQLIELPDDRLRDIGVSRLEAIQEAQKPFWRP